MTTVTLSIPPERAEQLHILARHYQMEVPELIGIWIDKALAFTGLGKVTPREPEPETLSIEELLGDLEAGVR